MDQYAMNLHIFSFDFLAISAKEAPTWETDKWQIGEATNGERQFISQGNDKSGKRPTDPPKEN